MQVIFLEDERKIKSFIATISKARLSKYLSKCGGNEKDAILLYHWNSQLSQSLYLPLQSFEIALRNRLNEYLIYLFGARWPYDSRALRTLANPEIHLLQKTIDRGVRERRSNPTTDQVVADLSIGFWVSLLAKRYHVPLKWRKNLASHIFTRSRELSVQAAWEKCRRLRDLRNRVAHHEPVFHLKLDELRVELDEMLIALCESTHAYMSSACSFKDIWANPPAVGTEGKGQLSLGQI